jgi:Transposase DDE domain
MSTTRRSRKKTKKRSTVRHTRAIQRDRTKRPISMPLDEQVSEHLTQIIHPATLAQVAHFHQLGLRERLLGLPVMVALVLTLLWRQIASVGELVRLLRSEGFLWCSPVLVSQQALSQRLRTFPAELFLRVLQDLLPQMQARAQARHRPLPQALAWAKARYEHVLAVDGSTLDALLRKVGLLRDLPTNPLAGRMTALLDLCSRLPRQVWFEEDPQAHDQRFWPRIQAAVQPGTLLLFDLGYTNFGVFAQLSASHVTWLTRAKSNLAYTLERWLVHTDSLQDALVWIGSGAERQQVRLVQVRVGRTWYRYLTSELDPVVLPAPYVAAVYAQRWRIEEAYALVKRLLGLAYFFVGSQNGVQLQLFATWLLYAVLVDLTDAVAESLDAPLSALSLEMVYRSIYYFSQAFHRGQADDPVLYLAENAKWLGILKRRRKRDGPQLPALPLLTNPAGA